MPHPEERNRLVRLLLGGMSLNTRVWIARAWPRVFFLDRRLHGCRQAENVRLAENCVKSGARSVPYGRERTDDSELGVHALDCGYFDNPNCFSTKGKNWDGSRSRACDRLNSALKDGLFSPRSNWPM